MQLQITGRITAAEVLYACTAASTSGFEEAKNLQDLQQFKQGDQTEYVLYHQASSDDLVSS